MEKAGANVKIAVDPIVLTTDFIFMLICFARFIERIKKKIDCARTKQITIPATI